MAELNTPEDTPIEPNVAETPKRGMTEDELAALCAAEIQDSTGYIGGDISNQRRTYNDYYYGKPLGNEIEGRSQVVSSDVQDTVEWIMPSLLKMFTSGERIVQFDPTGPEDEQAAEQETDYINHIWHDKNPGFLVIYQWFKDGLLNKNGFIKWAWEKTSRDELEQYRGLTDDELVLFVQQNPGVQITNHTAHPTQDGSQVHDLTVRSPIEEAGVKVYPVPPNEFLISRGSRAIKGARFVGHRQRKTLAALLEMGLPRNKVMRLQTNETFDMTLEEFSRVKAFDEMRMDNASPLNELMRETWVTECYLRVDFNNDGKPELRRILMGGANNGEVLINEEYNGSDAPFASITPIIKPHTFFGVSVAELVIEIQKIKTMVTRAMLDSLYLQVNPVTVIVDGEVNLDDVLDKRPGSIVRTNKPGVIEEMMPPPVAQQAIPFLQYFDDIKEKRTGVTSYNQGTDSESLNKTASGINQIMGAAVQRIELIARTYAETGVKDAFLGIHELVRKYTDKQAVVRLRNKWVPVDPREWKTRTDMSVSVGLGHGNPQMIMGVLNQVLLAQQNIVKEQGGINGPLVTGLNIYNALRKFCEAAGLKHVEPYFTDPSTAPPVPKQPSPEEQRAAADVQVAQAKVQQTQIKTFADIHKAAADIHQSQQKVQPQQPQGNRMRNVVFQRDAQGRIAGAQVMDGEMPTQPGPGTMQ